MLALPLRHGGLGILDPSKNADREYTASKSISSSLSDCIYGLDMDISNVDQDQMKEKRKNIRTQNDENQKLKMISVRERLDERSQRYLDGARQKGSSAWLSCLPQKHMGYSLNKREFRDALCLRYGWRVSDMPTHCACGERNGIEHVLTCKKGGYVSMRHNAVRDMEAAIMKDVTKDVQVEPPLLPVGNVQLKNGTNTADHARLDIAARGIWSPCERTLFDVRITHPHCPSNAGKSLDALLIENENQKLREYNDRVIEVEKATFVPLVFSTNGGMSPQCQRLHTQLALLISRKR